MIFLAQLLTLAIDVFIFIMIIYVVLNLLMFFDVVNPKNKQAQKLYALLGRACEPVLSKIREYIPPMGGFDISPIVVLFGGELLKYAIWQLAGATV